ncbi:MAG: 50S ribosomal protein L31e [Candidatus Hermodarchaeota archaeon]
MSEDMEERTIEERVYTVSFGKIVYGRGIPRIQRANRAIKHLQKFTRRHMKTDNVIIHPQVNEAIWSRGIKKPPRRLRVRIVKSEEDTAEVFLT